jgi:hypothetical protein
VRYRHYKGGIYEWVCESKLESDPSTTLVIYRSEDGKTWARPRQVFFEQVEYEGKLVPRFERID